MGLSVRVVEVAPRLLPRQVDSEGSALLQERLRRIGFEFFLGAKNERIQSGFDQVQVFLAGGPVSASDLVLISAGILPRVELAREAESEVRRGIVVDDFMRTRVPDIYAVGDAAEWHETISGLWPAAQAMGRIAGANAAGDTETYPGQVPSTTLKVAGVDLCSQGDIRADGAQVLVRHDSDRGYWVKLFLRDGVPAGSIQIGGTQGAFQLKRLMDRRLSIRGFEDQILSDEFDFNHIPSFADSGTHMERT